MDKSTSRNLTVCLVSHHPVALEGFGRALEPMGCPVEKFPLESQLGPDLAQVELPEASVYVLDSLATARATEALVGGIRKRNRRARIVVLAESFDEATAFTLLRLGVKGMVRYAESDQQMARAADAVASGGYWVSRALLARFVDLMLGEIRIPPDLNLPTALSPREREVLDSLLKNLANKEIGNLLNISERTVKFHVSNLLQKFGVQRRADLILLCYQSRPPESPAG